MSLQGQHLEPLAPTSPEFLHYQTVFGAQKLTKLYKIVYQPKGMYNLEHFNDYPTIFYHGTGHCGCVLRRGIDAESNNIYANKWCGVRGCATQGILNHGHMRAFSVRGHFFSPNWGTAQGYSLQKSAQNAYLSMFLVKAHHVYNPATDICSVSGDTDILPCFLAILSHP